MAPTIKTRSKKRGFLNILLLVLFGLLLALWQRQAIFDWLQLRNYSAPQSISRLATDDTMTDYARRIYYVNHPVLQDKATFATSCPGGKEQTVVLGCYKGGQRGIYLFDVDNGELAGIKQVTAAHEMLHAAYDRLSANDRQHVNAMLTDYFNNKLTDDTVKKTIEGYKKTEPDDLVNEMHSIFATQIDQLPSDLSEYYTRYFTSRKQVTNYYGTYEQAFSSRQQQITQFDSQLNSLKTQVDQLELTVKSQQAGLQTQRESLDREKANGNREAYNSSVDSYNNSVNVYNANVVRLRGLIEQYNQLVERRNSIAFEERALVQSLSAQTQ